MPWLRLWTDILDDVDLHALPRETRWAWTAFLAAAKKFDKDGELPALKVLAHWVREPQGDVSRWIDELVTAGMLDRNGVTVSVHGWQRWQAKADKTNAQRQAAWRERHSGGGSPPPAPPREEKNREREEVTTLVTPLRNGTPPHAPSEIDTGRTGDEHALFVQVVQELESFVETKYLGGQLVMYADTPGIRAYESWRLLVAARVVQRPDKPKSWNTFTKSAQNATWDEYQRLTKKLPGGGMTITGVKPSHVEIKASADDEDRSKQFEAAMRAKFGGQPKAAS